MAHYEGKEVVFDYPDTWVDKTIAMFGPPPSLKKGSSANVVLTREQPKKGESLKTFAARQMTEMAKKLKNFELIENRDRAVGGAPAVELEFTWAAPSGELLQRMTMVQHGFAILIFTGSAPLTEAAASRPVFDRLIDSVQLRDQPVTSIARIPPPSDPIDPGPPQGWGPGSRRR